MKSKRFFSIVISIIVIIVTLSVSQAADFLLVEQGKGITHVKSGKKIRFSSSCPVEAIEWAMKHSPITIIGEGTYTLSSHISIPHGDISLVIAEKAELATAKDSKVIDVTENHGNYHPLIYNARHNNVNIINFGTLNLRMDDPGEGQVTNSCIIYDGRNSGANGIEGGMIFSCGEFKSDGGDSVWIVDSNNVKVPLIWSRSTSNTMAIEGSDNIKIGIVAELNYKGEGEDRGGNEAIDLNSFNRNIKCDLVIGTAPVQETLDINNSPGCVFKDVRTYGGGHTFRTTVYPPTGRRLTQKSYINNSDGTVVKKDKVIEKKIKSWQTDFKVTDLLENLPVITVTAKLNGVFEDDSQELMFFKTWHLNLEPGGKWNIRESQTRSH